MQPYPRPLAATVAHEESTCLVFPPFVAVSTALRRLLLQAEITASRLQFATIEGEHGTGKHLFAQTLHQHAALGNLPFHRCDAREWLASEADPSVLKGTLYLDRVDLLAPTGQNLLLNLLKMLQGSTTDESTRRIQFLLLVSTHTSLRHLASQGRFLPDLAFRLTAVRFPLPPLREHREDIAPITQTLIDRICRHYQQPTAVLAPGTLPRLLQHSWPGNVRELASVLESAILESSTGILRSNDLNLDPQITPAAIEIQQSPPEILPTTQSEPSPGASLATSPAQPTASPLPTDLTLDAVIHHHIQIVLQLNRGNKLRAARQLGISRSTLYRLLAGGFKLPAL